MRIMYCHRNAASHLQDRSSSAVWQVSLGCFVCDQAWLLTAVGDGVRQLTHDGMGMTDFTSVTRFGHRKRLDLQNKRPLLKFELVWGTDTNVAAVVGNSTVPAWHTGGVGPRGRCQGHRGSQNMCFKRAGCSTLGWLSCTSAKTHCLEQGLHAMRQQPQQSRPTTLLATNTTQPPIPKPSLERNQWALTASAAAASTLSCARGITTRVAAPSISICNICVWLFFIAEWVSHAPRGDLDSAESNTNKKLNHISKNRRATGIEKLTS